MLMVKSLPPSDTSAISPLLASTRVLVVDDFQPFRAFVSSLFSKAPELQIICEVSDGLEAVQKAKELRPDLILLDVGLQRLNGIEAARQIRKLALNSKILFQSQETSSDVVQEALSLGAMGYVAKADAGSDLLAAVEALRQGRQFLSAGVSGHVSRPRDARSVDCLGDKTVLA